MYHVDKILHARHFAKQNLLQLAKEMLEWRGTGILCDGKVRELARMFDFVPAHDRLNLAESVVNEAALEAVIALSPIPQAKESPKIKVGMTEAIKVRFRKPIFEEDFPEKGMVAMLTDVEWHNGADCYKLYFDFTEFEQENLKYFKADYFPNSSTAKLQAETGRTSFTAIETGNYDPKYWAYFSLCTDVQDDAQFEKEIEQYLQVME